MEDDPIKNEARRKRRERRFGPDARCILCGHANPSAFVRVTKEFLEAHHVVGRANDEGLLLPLCRNCHAYITEGYRDAGVSMNPPATVLHRLQAALKALGVFLPELGAKCGTWAFDLRQFMNRLDRELPNWKARWGETSNDDE